MATVSYIALSTHLRQLRNLGRIHYYNQSHARTNGPLARHRSTRCQSANLGTP